ATCGNRPPIQAGLPQAPQQRTQEQGGIQPERGRVATHQEPAGDRKSNSGQQVIPGPSQGNQPAPATDEHQTQKDQDGACDGWRAGAVGVMHGMSSLEIDVLTGSAPFGSGAGPYRLSGQHRWP